MFDRNCRRNRRVQRSGLLESLETRVLLATDLGFTPLANSAPLGDLPESTPFSIPVDHIQQVVQSHFADADLLDWPDMTVVNETAVRDHGDLGRYVFTTHESLSHAAVSRTDTWTGETAIITQRSDLERFDGLVWTPWGTLLAAEEVVSATRPDPAAQVDPERVSENPFPSVEEAFADKYSGLVYEIDPFPEDFSNDDSSRAIVIGHRGASGYRPEHTLESYRLAVELGADFIEPDLVATKDGILITRHENELSGTTDVAAHPEFADRMTTTMIDGIAVTGWFSEDFTLAEIKTLRAKERIPGVRSANTDYDGIYEIPTLSEVIDLVKQIETQTGKKIGIYPETKHPTFFLKEGRHVDGSPINADLSQLLINTLVANQFTDPSRIFIQSFEVENLLRLHDTIMPAAGVDIPLVQLFGDTNYDYPDFSFAYDIKYNTLSQIETLNTSADPYAYDISGTYDVIPILTVGDEMPLLTSTIGDTVTVSDTLTYAMAGIPDGLGIYETATHNFVFINHEYGNGSTSIVSSTIDGQIQGSRVSLIVFDKQWQVLGGKNLIEQVVDGDQVYTLDLESGNLVDVNGEVFNSLFFDGGGFARFCSGYLASSGFLDATGTEAPVWFAPEEGGDNSRGWAVFTDGTAYPIAGLGQYSKEQVVAASQFRPGTAANGQTVIISTEDDNDGEVYMFVGQQDPQATDVMKRNGMADGDLYVLRMKDPNGNVWADEAFMELGPANYVAEWVPVPKELQFSEDGGGALREWVNDVDEAGMPRSTNFARPEDVSEDPNQPGTFYFVTTGASGTPNDFGSLYRFTLNPADITGNMSLDFLMSGGPDTGVSYDNMTVTTDGKVAIQEDRTAGGGTVMANQTRQARVLTYDIATGETTYLFEMNQGFIDFRNFKNYGSWESSGIVEVGELDAGTGLASYLFDVQAHSLRNSDYVEGGQLVLARPNPNAAASINEIYGGLTDVLDITPATGYSEFRDPVVIQYFAGTYADGIGPWKNSFLLRESLETPVDGNGDGAAQITTRLTGEVDPFVSIAIEAGLDVHPYTLRAEEPFLTVDNQRPDNYTFAPESAQTLIEEIGQLLELGVTGFFIDNPDIGVQGRAAHYNATPLPSIGSVSHEGLAIDVDGNVYVVDEFAEGSIYRFVPDVPGELSAGSLSVLRLASGTTGVGEWVPLEGDLATVNTRNLARAVGATIYNRPEDVEYYNGALYVAVTGDDRVLAIDLSDPPVPVVHNFVTSATTNAADGNYVGAEFDSPDNLAIDAHGRLFITEDISSGTVAAQGYGNDIWAAVDLNGDYRADRIGRFASLTTIGAEPSGIYVSPFEPNSLYVNVQHAASTNEQIIKISSAPDLGFTPLAISALLEPEASPRETQAPLDLNEGWTQEVIQYGSDPDAEAPNQDPRAHVELYERNLDMIVVNETGPDAGRYLFTSHEVRRGSPDDPEEGGGGVSRLDLTTGDVVVISQRGDYESFDGMLWTPWGTILTGEERVTQTSFLRDPDLPDAVSGLAYEIINPLGDPNDPDPANRPQTIARPAIGSLAHEGMRLDSAGNLYIVHEFANGSIYKYIPDHPNQPDAFEHGRLFVLQVLSAPQGLDSEGNYQSNSERVGAAHWIEIAGSQQFVFDTLPTDFNQDGVVDDLDLQIVSRNFGLQDAAPEDGDTNEDGLVDLVDVQAVVDTFGQSTIVTVQLEDHLQVNAQEAADRVGGTRFFRPEDVEVGVNAAGHEMLYVALTGAAGSSNSGDRALNGPRVISIELGPGRDTVVRNFVTPDTLNAYTGRRVGSEFENPDNLAIDADGNIYVVEDNSAGDIWRTLDQDGNGQAEVIGRWASVSTLGAEPTGLYFNPVVVGEAFVNIQHPSSGQDATLRLRSGGTTGDANGDGIFDSADLVQILQRGKYLTGEPATFADGDWNGDGIFDQSDLVLALQEGNYKSGNAVAVDLAIADDDDFGNVL